MSTPAAPLVMRVVLATHDPFELDRVLSQALVLAGELRAEVAGLFVEEADLLRLAALPISREVGIASEAVRGIDMEATVRLLQRRADECRRLLAAEAARANLPWSFTVTQGRLVEVAHAAAAGADLVVVGPVRTAVQHAVGTRAPRRSDVSVAAVFDGTAAGGRALAAALHLTRRRPEAITLVIPETGDAEELRAFAQRQLGGSGWSPEVVRLSDLARTRAPGAVVVSLASLQPLGVDLGQLLGLARCPLVLLR